jgi:hypothetical protein
MKTRIPVENPTEECTRIEVKVDYYLGGANYFSGNVNRRGIWLYVSPIKVSDGAWSTILGSGSKKLLEELPRKNAKKLKAAGDMIDGQLKAATGIAWEIVQHACHAAGVTVKPLLSNAVKPLVEATA